MSLGNPLRSSLRGSLRSPLGRGLTAGGSALTLALAAAAAYPAVRAAHADAAPPITVRYKTGQTSGSAGEIEPWLEIVNTSTAPIPLSAIKVRYYFTADAPVPYTFACAWARPGCANLSASVAAISNPASTADHYLQIGFAAGAGTLAPGADTGDLQLRLYRSDWQNVDQSNDYSFNGADTAYTANDHVTAYDDGALVWGTDPTGASPPTSPPPTSPPSGQALFDDFSYAGPSDSGLAAHGWSVRTGGGGPGIAGTWSANAISFPADSTAQGGKVMQLQATTDGTMAGTTQAEIDTSQRKFFEGTYAARVYFNDAPTTGQDGDHVNQTFYTITPDDSLYSELDNEYLPNGGWGAPGPTLYTTTWYSADAMDRQTHNVINSLQGWHTLQMTVNAGTVTYYVDGQPYFSTTGKYYPREKMTIDFNEWFIDLPFTGARTWNEKVNWVYFNAGTLTPGQVTTAVNGYYANGTHFTDTVPNG
ncbi:cellulose binding domain-containing protein [Actinomadura opuntiae]|uniref:cellulose binding domain-containing protein n=1 Tax=Actinomadura sp. OS1-43 TaxID=604315 RepID=UPI00255A87CB|nr:cellulose binding domain-containing protein [Actinomadura sp. OS1-43]MDL4818490.1 cellulose binding domain-containing protein [Actinomadura sp. OS1-43]